MELSMPDPRAMRSGSASRRLDLDLAVPRRQYNADYDAGSVRRAPASPTAGPPRAPSPYRVLSLEDDRALPRSTSSRSIAQSPSRQLPPRAPPRASSPPRHSPHRSASPPRSEILQAGSDIPTFTRVPDGELISRRPPPAAAPLRVDLEPTMRKLKKTDLPQYVERLEQKLAEVQLENKSLKRQLAQARGGTADRSVEDELQRLRRRIKQLEADLRPVPPPAVPATPLGRPPAPARRRSHSAASRISERGPPSPSPSLRPGASPAVTLPLPPAPGYDSVSYVSYDGVAGPNAGRPWYGNPIPSSQPLTYTTPPIGSPLYSAPNVVIHPSNFPWDPYAAPMPMGAPPDLPLYSPPVTVRPRLDSF